MLPLLFQIVMGKSAFASGVLMLVYAAGNLGMKTITTPLLRRFGFRRVIVGNGFIVAFSLVVLACIGPGIPDAVIAAMLFAAGLCRSLQFTTVNTLSFVDVPQAIMSSASTLASMFTQLAQAGGIAAGALLLHGVGAARGTGATPDLADFHVSFVLAAIIALAATLSLLSLPRTAGNEVSGYST
jgi:Na+/melibiose symporter-like transporter